MRRDSVAPTSFFILPRRGGRPEDSSDAPNCKLTFKVCLLTELRRSDSDETHGSQIDRADGSVVSLVGVCGLVGNGRGSVGDLGAPLASVTIAPLPNGSTISPRFIGSSGAIRCRAATSACAPTSRKSLGQDNPGVCRSLSNRVLLYEMQGEWRYGTAPRAHVGHPRVHT
jgi:hypothetical protein